MMMATNDFPKDLLYPGTNESPLRKGKVSALWAHHHHPLVDYRFMRLWHSLVFPAIVLDHGGGRYATSSKCVNSRRKDTDEKRVCEWWCCQASGGNVPSAAN